MAASEKLTIDTPEHIALEFTLASAGSRFLALAADTLIQAGVFLGAGLLALGMRRRVGALRKASLAIVLVTSGKVFLYDLSELGNLYRVASLAGLAVSLLGVSLLYQRFVFRAQTEGDRRYARKSAPATASARSAT